MTNNRDHSLNLAQEKIIKLTHSLYQAKKDISELEKKIRYQEKLLGEKDAIIEGIYSSKFWQIRNIWFKFKKLFTPSLYQKYWHKFQTFLLLKKHFNSSYAFKILTQKEIIPVTDNIDYQLWLNLKYPRKDDLISMAVNVISMAYKPVISIIMPTYNTPEEYLRDAIASVIDQVYPYWELCIADDNSTLPHVQEILEEYSQQDKRIKVCYREINGHISQTANSAIKLATGEYIALLDHDDLLTPHALYEVVKLLNQHPEADFIYSDEDNIDSNGKLRTPFFKPDWCPDSFLARMFTCHLGVYRKAIVDKIGGFRVGFEGSQDYDLVLRFTEETDNIFHIPDILYHWRAHSESTAYNPHNKLYAYEAATRAIKEAITRRGEKGEVIMNERVLGVYTIRYQIKNPSLVSIIISTRDLSQLLDNCLKSIFAKTTYPHYEVIVIDNGSIEPQTQACLEYWLNKQPQRFSYYPYDIPFNYSKLNNYGVEKAKGEYLLFLNNDTEIITPDWLEGMVEQAQRESIGVVGCKLLYPDHTIQHAGVIVGLNGVSGHIFSGYPDNDEGYFRQLITVNNYSALTGACMMCRREIFTAVNGFEEYLEVACNDIDFCLKVKQLGYHNVYLPHVVLYHHESQSRGLDDTPEKKARVAKEFAYMRQKWHNFIDYDPCYNPNLHREKGNCSIKIDG